MNDYIISTQLRTVSVVGLVPEQIQGCKGSYSALKVVEAHNPRVVDAYFLAEMERGVTINSKTSLRLKCCGSSSAMG